MSAGRAAASPKVIIAPWRRAGRAADPGPVDQRAVPIDEFGARTRPGRTGPAARRPGCGLRPRRPVTTDRRVGSCPHRVPNLAAARTSFTGAMHFLQVARLREVTRARVREPCAAWRARLLGP